MRLLPNDRDINFLLNAAILALIIMAVIHAIAPIVAPPPDTSKEVQAYMADITPIRPRDIEKKLHVADGRGSMLVVYATWCSYCRKLLPGAVSLLKDEEMKGVQPLFLALDDDAADVAGYTVNQGYAGMYTPYIIQQGTSNELIGALSVTDSNFKGHIPYVGFFGPDGKLVAETYGMVDKERLRAGLKKLKASP